MVASGIIGAPVKRNVSKQFVEKFLRVKTVPKLDIMKPFVAMSTVCIVVNSQKLNKHMPRTAEIVGNKLIRPPGIYHQLPLSVNADIASWKDKRALGKYQAAGVDVYHT
ncbi:hypothetical protein RB195_014377 [Necator americanus]|uniref:Uncharacterized protein n=1 Tax=Necator americanus TaxID=51031 RepID=A0ABR1DZS1_NECAM